MSSRRHGPAGPFARFVRLLSAAAPAVRRSRRTRTLAARPGLRLEPLESRAMLSSAPFIAELPQDLAVKSTSLFTVQGRYGNNALNGDWELGITSNTSAPPQQQSQRSWGDGRGTRTESFTFAITRSPASLFASPAATSGDFTIGGSNVKASYTDIASYEPNAIKIWARSTTVGGGVMISDLKIRTPGVPGETVFPGTVINVSQGSGTGFQEIIIAGIDFQSSSDGTVTLEGSVAMQFGNAPAPRGSSLQFHVIATHIPWVDLDVDSNNDDKIDPVNGRNGTDDRIEQAAPGLFVPVEGKRSKMLVTIPAGRNATLEIKPDAAGKVQVFSQFAQVSPLTFDKVGPNDEPAIKMADVPGGVTTGAMTTWTLWVAATAPSTSRGDIVFTLTGDNNGLPAWDIVRATAVAVDIDVDSDNDGKIDPENAATGSDDPIEPDQSRGLVVPVYAGDSDRDGVDDTVDFNGIAGRRFAPVKVGLSEGAALAWQWPIRSVGSPDEDLPGLTFTFSFSDAGFGSATGGMFRLWKKDAPDVRNVADLIRTGVPIRASELLTGQPFTTLEEYLRNHGTTTLYLEAVSPSAAYEPIEVSIGGTGVWANSKTIDTVHVRGVKGTLDLHVDSNNDEGFGVPGQRSPWEEKLESHDYAIGKLVMQSSSSALFERDVEGRLAASFTPVVVELPRNLPMDARTIGVKFAMDAIGALNSGEIQLWNHNKGPGLLPQDAAGQPHPIFQSIFGHRVYFNKPYTLSQINYDPKTGFAVLYMDGHNATKNVRLNDVEQGGRLPGILHATLTFDAPDLRIPLAEDSVQYMVVRDDFFYHDFQFKPEVRSAMASRGVYSYADLPNFAIQRLSQDALGGLFGEEADPAIPRMLYTDLDNEAYPGFKAVLYQDFAAQEDNTFLLAFAGTDDTAGEFFDGKGFDWAENVWQGLGWDLFQYQYAMKVATAVDAAMEGLIGGAFFTTTGHSLGGGLASAASIVTGAAGITFNAAGLHTNTVRQFLQDPVELNAALERYNQAQGLIRAFHVDYDFLTHLQTLGSPFGIPTALGTAEQRDGPYDRQAMVAGVTFVLVPGIGGVLGPVWLVAVEVKAHLMPAMLWGLLVQEGITGTRTRDTLGYDSSRF